MLRWLTLAAAIVAEVSGSLALKAAGEQSLWDIWVVIGYGAAFFFLDRVLRNGMALGVAYGIWAAAGVALTAVFAALIFGEAFTGLMGIGIVLIMGGVLLVEMGSHAPKPQPQQQES